ncbi:AMP-binding protein [Lysinibacillus sp. NPDC097195]|uniref:AMP-binding protein n=1 Tax=Lysinibacillus sp. NPDC097195 TaxID=3364141 RepID=UPI0037FE5717
MNIIEPIIEHAVRQPNEIALVHEERVLTYHQLIEAMKKIAKGIQLKGLEDEKIAILSNNRIEFVEVFLGIIYAGCVPILFDPKWSQYEIDKVLKLAQPKMIFFEDMHEEYLQKYPFEQIEKYVFSKRHDASYDKWLSTLITEDSGNKAKDPIFIGFTSGTTGTPKGYERTHDSWLKSFIATKEAFHLKNLNNVLAPGPFVQSLSLFALMQSLYFGGTYYMMTTFDEEKVVKYCRQVPNLILFLVPTMIEKLLNLEGVEDIYAQAIISSGAKWSEQSKARAKKLFGATKLYEFYGSSEASYISYLDVQQTIQEHIVGQPFPGVAISIRDAQQCEVSKGEIGLLYVRSEMMFSRYFQLPEETNAVFHEGWLKTGDYMMQDDTGALHLVGRANNMLITGGLNVYPEEVETVLKRHVAVDDMIIVGVPDDYWGERLVACIKWHDSRSLSIEELQHFGAQFLASFKLPKQLVTVQNFIYTSSGKIARKAMKDWVMEALT